jgi:hypothetical protein
LPDDIASGKSGQAGIFGTAFAVGQMAIAARKDIGLSTVGDNLGHGRMARGMPVGWTEQIFNLSERECRAAAGYVPRSIVDGPGGRLGIRIDNVGPVRRNLMWILSPPCSVREQEKREDPKAEVVAHPYTLTLTLLTPVSAATSR